MSYDPDQNMLRIEFRPGTRPTATRCVTRLVSLHLDSRERPVALTVRGASGQIPESVLASLVPDEQYLTLKQAASVARLSPITLRGRIHCAQLKAMKRGRDWIIRRCDLEEFLTDPPPREWDF